MGLGSMACEMPGTHPQQACGGGAVRVVVWPPHQQRAAQQAVRQPRYRLQGLHGFECHVRLYIGTVIMLVKEGGPCGPAMRC